MTSEAALERRYRQLLRLYPSEHRREYEEEMLGVLLAAASGRRGPGLREVLDLVFCAFTARWSRGTRGLRDGSWQRAARAVQLFGAILLFAVALRRVVMGEVAAVRYADFVPHLTAAELVRPAAWALVLLLVLVGWRWATVPAALVGLAAEAPPPGLYLDTPARLLDVYWILVAAGVVASTSLLTAVAGRERPVGEGRLPRGTAFVALGGAVVVACGAGTVLIEGPGLMLGGRLIPFVVLALYAAAGLLVALGVLRLPPPVVRRVVVSAVPVVVAWPLIRVGFGDLIATNLRAPEPALLGPVQWTALVLVPLAATWVAAILNSRFESSGRPGTPSV